MDLQIHRRRTCVVKNKPFVVGCALALLGFEFLIVVYVLAFPEIVDLWWIVFLGCWARFFLPFVPNTLRELSYMDILLPLIMISSVILLFKFPQKKLAALLIVEICAWQFIGLAWLMFWI